MFNSYAMTAPPREANNEKELIVVTREEARVNIRGINVSAAPGWDPAPLRNLMIRQRFMLMPLFGKEDQLRAERLTNPNIPNLSGYYRIYPPSSDPETLLSLLTALDLVESAFVRDREADSEPSLLHDGPLVLPPPIPTTGTTADFSDQQLYLGAAPQGVDAEYAWTLPGGKGEGVKLAMIVLDWHKNHEDLPDITLASGTPPGASGYVQAGTALFGVLAARHNGLGVKGLCPNA